MTSRSGIPNSLCACLFVHSFGHVAIFCTCAYDLILRLRKLFQGRSRFVVWILSYLGWVYSKPPRNSFCILRPFWLDTLLGSYVGPWPARAPLRCVLSRKQQKTRIGSWIGPGRLCSNSCLFFFSFILPFSTYFSFYSTYFAFQLTHFSRALWWLHS